MQWLPGDVERIQLCSAYHSPLAVAQGAIAVQGQEYDLMVSRTGQPDNNSNLSFSSSGSVQVVDVQSDPSSEDMASTTAGQALDSHSSLDSSSRYEGHQFGRSGPQQAHEENLSMQSALSSLQSASTRASVVSRHRRAMARAQRSGWCGLGMPFPGEGSLGSIRLYGIEDDEVIRRCDSMDVVVEIGNERQGIHDISNWLDGTVGMVGLAPEDGTERSVRQQKFKTWILCGSVGVHGDPPSNPGLSNYGGSKGYGISKGSHSKSHKKNSCMGQLNRSTDCGCWTMCTSPRC